jgi:Sigma-70, region 4
MSKPVALSPGGRGPAARAAAAVLVLRYWADLPVAEVAGILGCSEGTVTSTASRAAARLAVALSHNAPPAAPTRGPQPRKGNI